MLDKKELIQALWGEEDREHQKAVDKIRRQVLWKGVWASIVAVVVVVGWPLWRHVYDVGLVNFEVYGDRKRLEIQKCIQYKTLAGSMGVLLMILVDLIQFWLSATVLLSWVMTSKYFFPIPSLAIRPGQFMGEKVAKGPMGRYGMNVAPMAISWAIRFTRGQVETWTARALSSAYQKEKKEARANESEEEKAARKAARKAAKRAAKEEARLQEEERLQKETLRRKEMAEQATSKLFGRGQQQQPQEPKPEWQQQRKNPFPDDHHNDDDDDDVPVDYDEEPDTRREFEEDLKDVDINDLD
jgi:flagellar biosynthesis GTPase FlhF